MLLKALKSAQKKLVVWWEVRQWLAANDPAIIASNSMWLLNRWAFNRRREFPETTHTIYRMKDDLIRKLYDAGNCAKLGLTIQHFPCWGCGGTGQTHYWHDEFGEEESYSEALHDCDRCGGTGDYRTVNLYRFVFNVSGRYYSWHCPNVRWLPDGAIQPESEPDHIRGRMNRDNDVRLGSSRKYHIEAVRQFVYGGLPALGLSAALAIDMRAIRYRLRIRRRRADHEIPF